MRSPMKSLIMLLLLTVPLSAMAATWGQVEYKDMKRQSVTVKIERLVEGKGRLTFTEGDKEPRRVELTRRQFSDVTAWLRFNYMREERARKIHGEKSSQCEVVGRFKATSGLTSVDLCKDNARQTSLARQTANFFKRF